MGRSKKISSRLREILLDGHWIANTNYREVLKDVHIEQAKRKFGSLNTIADLVYHVDYYIGGVLNVLEGGSLEIRDKYSFDLPEVKNEEDWGRLKDQLFDHARRFAERVEELSDDQLEANFVHEKYGTTGRNIEGIIEHSYYHLGQIVLLKKLTGDN